MDKKAVLVGQFAKLSDLADGSIRISIDIPKEYLNEIGAIYSRGAGCAIARMDDGKLEKKEDVNVGAEVEREEDDCAEEGFSEKTKVNGAKSETRGPLCMRCIGLMNNREFKIWFYKMSYNYIIATTEKDKKEADIYRDAVCKYLGVKSRKEIDGDKHAIIALKNLESEFARRVRHE